MAHFAEIDSNNVVTRVLVTNNNQPNEGYDWIVETFGGTWIKTSYNTWGGKHLFGETPFRKNFASIGHTYDEQRDAFIPPRPFDSWALNEETCQWEPPVVMPEDGKTYSWDEETISWVEVTEEL